MATRKPAPVKTAAKDPRTQTATSGAAAPSTSSHSGGGTQPPEAPLGTPKTPDTPKAPVKDELVSVSVHTAFNLTLDSGDRVRYETGVQDIPRSHAEHWYSAHHLEKNED